MRLRSRADNFVFVVSLGLIVFGMTTAFGCGGFLMSAGLTGLLLIVVAPYKSVGLSPIPPEDEATFVR